MKKLQLLGGNCATKGQAVSGGFQNRRVEGLELEEPILPFEQTGEMPWAFFRLLCRRLFLMICGPREGLNCADDLSLPLAILFSYFVSDVFLHIFNSVEIGTYKMWF